jgi:hypothetical protein
MQRNEDLMLTTIMKCVAVATLLAGMSWHVSSDFRTYLSFIVTAAAVFVMVQAIILRKYAWAISFLAVVCLFNPLQPVGFSSPVLIALEVISAGLFAVSLYTVRTKPRMTIASITEAGPTESL